MAAMIKATIDRDETQPVITSYSAKTISLSKARALRTRPPDLLPRPGEGLAIDIGDVGAEADVEDEGGARPQTAKSASSAVREDGDSHITTIDDDGDDDDDVQAGIDHGMSVQPPPPTVQPAAQPTAEGQIGRAHV